MGGYGGVCGGCGRASGCGGVVVWWWGVAGGVRRLWWGVGVGASSLAGCKAIKFEAKSWLRVVAPHPWKGKRRGEGGVVGRALTTGLAIQF